MRIAIVGIALSFFASGTLAAREPYRGRPSRQVPNGTVQDSGYAAAGASARRPALTAGRPAPANPRGTPQGWSKANDLEYIALGLPVPPGTPQAPPHDMPTFPRFPNVPFYR